MRGRLPGVRRSRRSTSGKPSTSVRRVLRCEWLEPREMLSGSTANVLQAARPAAPNAAPTVSHAITLNGAAAVTGKTASLSVLGSDDGGETKLNYRWSIIAAPSGGSAGFSSNGSNAAKNVTATFNEAGSYTLSVTITDAGGLSATTAKSLVVTPALTSIRVTTAGGQAVANNGTLNVAGSSQSLAVQGYDQFNNLMSAAPGCTWSVTTTPSGAPKPSVNGGASMTVGFGKAGTYALTVQAKAASGAALSSKVSFAVAPVLSGLKNTPTAPVSTGGTSLQLAVPTFVDQFGSVWTSSPALTWSISALPTTGYVVNPTFTTSGGATSVHFGAAGSYGFTATVNGYANLSFTESVNVVQTLTSVRVTPGSTSVAQGSTQQFTAQGLDQFQNALSSQPGFSWSATGGTITSSGLFTAAQTLGSGTVTARCGLLAATAAVSVISSGSVTNSALWHLVQTLDADGSLSRADVIQILQSAAADGTVDATEFAGLKQMLNQAATLNIANYVQVLAGDVILGNAANATYQGQALGNLGIGSSGTQLTSLINKWFYGTDHPTLCNTSLTYQATAGTLFPHTPSHADEVQGGMGDCYLITALGTLADSNPAAIQNAIINNGDGTYTVRFYTGNYGTIYNWSDGSIGAGFKDNQITADYVTVDSTLPAGQTGTLAYADYGASVHNAGNALWIPLLEKAYAQWNQTGKEGRDGTNAFASIQGGWMATVDAQILGHNATDYILTSSSAQVAINALNAHQAVTIGTGQWSAQTQDGLYASHAYAIIGYNAGNATFTLYNPWGSNQPGQLTWAQLQADCTQLCVCDTSSGSAAFGAAAGKVSAAALPAGLHGEAPLATGTSSTHSDAFQARRSDAAIEALTAADRPIHAAGATNTAAATTDDWDAEFAEAGHARGRGHAPWDASTDHAMAGVEEILPATDGVAV